MRSYAVVCASNFNRSMEAHYVLSKKGFDVKSFGTNSQVKIPSPDTPNLYAFGTPYEEIYADLITRNSSFYKSMGMLKMLERNMTIKRAPERFQDHEGRFEVIITCHERVYETLVTHILSTSTMSDPVYIVNFDIVDNAEDALLGGRRIAMLAERLEAAEDLETDFDRILEDFQKETKMLCLHTVAFY